MYVCDSMDGRQLKRKLRFDRWFFTYNDGSLIKQDGLAVIEDTEIYNSIILHKNNPQLLDIIFAFKDLNEKAPEGK